ncbi:beta-1,3-galactosyltransferase 5-like [Plodia interpunctella]|uniref:beta-1,3-galactosyltransferase 5-like n=1 Tax=Plodia interpunctella TaxID=58824 RepID=UPI002367EA3A|nr:beta-1,3-galactosyltransferase 5-like [Plodia interpunctella]
MAELCPIPCILVTFTSMIVLLGSITTQPELVVDRYVAGYEVGHPELCPAFGSELKIIIFVTSAPSHFKQREAIRMTWGDMSKFPKVSLAFFIGIPSNESRSLILEEESIYRDMIIARFIDTYDNLTLKSLSMFEWLNTYCPLVPRMLKTDDDMFINVPLLVKFVKKTLRNNGTKTIWGNLSADHLRVPVRDNTSKYFVTEEEFPGNKYPAFVTGPAYLISTDVTTDMFEAAADEPYLKIEDVFITGILAKKLKIKRIDVKIFYNLRIYGDPWWHMLDFLSVHNLTSDEVLESWQELQIRLSSWPRS